MRKSGGSAAVPGADQPLIRFDMVERTFEAAVPVRAVKGVSLKVDKGEMVAIMGPSGSGKSSLLAIMGCLDRPTRGEYYFRGYPTRELSDRRRSAIRADDIGFVFQRYHLIPHLSVLENVLLGGMYNVESDGDRRDQAVGAIERVGLGHRQDFFASVLSGGEMQRVAIARALMGHPRVLLCDEPTGNLDSTTAASVLDLFRRLNAAGLAIVIVTHEFEVAAACDRTVELVDGQLVASRSLELNSNDSTPAVSSASLPSNTQPVSSLRLWRRILGQAVAALRARTARTVLTGLGTVLGITSVLAVLGLAQTAGSEVISKFDQLAADQLTVRPSELAERSGGTRPIDWDALEQVARIDGVVAATAIAHVDDLEVVSGPLSDPIRLSSVDVVATSTDLVLTISGRMQQGRFFDSAHQRRRDRVAVLGAAAAADLGVVDVVSRPAISVNGNRLTVIGILDGVGSHQYLLESVLVPASTARDLFGTDSPSEIIIRSSPGATRVVGSQAAIAVNPGRPELLSIGLPPEPRQVREGIADTTQVLAAVVGLVSLSVGAISIANVTLVSVLERVPEIGLRRAMGAMRSHIAGQFLAEATLIGLVSGALGACLAVLVVSTVALMRDWQPVLAPTLVAVAPLIAAVVGLVAGLYPAVRAGLLEPTGALRRE